MRAAVIASDEPLEMLSPREVAQKMSFFNKLDPYAPPPNEAPPPLPQCSSPRKSTLRCATTPLGQIPEQDQLLQSYTSPTITTPTSSTSFSYQHGRPALQPTIYNYQDNEDNNARSLFAMRGDTNLQPNVAGLTNSYDRAPFGLALHELLEQVRATNAIASLASCSWTIVTWIWFPPSDVTRVVLSAYQCVLSVVLFSVELLKSWNIKSADVFLKDNFGMMRHPVGKAVYTVGLASLCFAIGGVGEILVGLVFLGSSCSLFYVWTVNPELRYLFQQEDKTDDLPTSDASMNNARWSYYSDSPNSFATPTTEKASLLGESR
jgi:hypothetical protein